MDKENKNEEFDINEIPSIKKAVGRQLPRFMKEIMEMGETDAEADALVLGALTTLSAALPNVRGMYGGRVVYPNLYFFLSAPASSGKGKMNLCKSLIMPIHMAKRNERKQMIDAVIAEQAAAGKRVTAADLNIPQKMLIIPGDATATAIYQGLGDNNGTGIIAETEADTVANSLSGEFSFSDGLRKAFHHETISYFRRKENEMVEIQNPRLSVVLAGTPKQVYRLIPTAEDGLFSRFMMYRMPRTIVWNDMFAAARGGCSYEEAFNNLGREFYRFYQSLERVPGNVEFLLREHQQRRFNAHFGRMQEMLSEVYGDDIVASVRRMGLIVYRIAMILSIVRMMDYGSEFVLDTVFCSDEDFDTAMRMSEVLIKHTVMIYKEMPEGEEAERNFDLRVKHSEMMLRKLPEKFCRDQALSVGLEMGLGRTTVDKRLRFMRETGMVEYLKRGYYEKAGAEEKTEEAA